MVKYILTTMTTIFYPFSKSAFLRHRIPFMTFPEKRLRKNKNRLRENKIREGDFLFLEEVLLQETITFSILPLVSELVRHCEVQFASPRFLQVRGKHDR